MLSEPSRYLSGIPNLVSYGEGWEAYFLLRKLHLIQDRHWGFRWLRSTGVWLPALQFCVGQFGESEVVALDISTSSIHHIHQTDHSQNRVVQKRTSSFIQMVIEGVSSLNQSIHAGVQAGRIHVLYQNCLQCFGTIPVFRGSSLYKKVIAQLFTFFSHYFRLSVFGD